MGKEKEQPASALRPEVEVPRILNECQHSVATHPRGIKKLVKCRAVDPDEFLRTWILCFEPLFLVSGREPVVERMIKFAASFTAYWDEVHQDDCEIFVENFLGVLLKWVDASHKAVRFRACQLISEVIIELPEDVPVADDLWERIISSMQRRMQDRMTSVRVFAARALSRLVTTDDIENDRTVLAYRQALKSDQRAEVRKMVVLSMPAMNATVADVVEQTADVSETVRKSTYNVLANKFRIESLSIMQRALVLRRGLGERVPAVRAMCVDMLKSVWFEKDCNGDVLTLLRYLDVETHEKEGENVMLELLKQGLDIKTCCTGGLRQFLPTGNETGPGEEEESSSYKLLDAEEALYWRMLCTHIHSEAEAKGSDAANTGGAEAVVNAAAAADSNDYLEEVLPPTVADYVRLVEAHVRGGPNLRFAARQLLMISKLMNFTDNTSRREAAALLHRLLNEVKSCESGQSLEDVVGDGLSLNGDESWGNSVAEFAHQVHAAPGELSQVLAASLVDHAGPCREGGADVLQWLHCLALTGLLFEDVDSLRDLEGLAIEAQEIRDSLLLPAVRHLHPEVQRAGVRCLGIYCCLERTPSRRGVEELIVTLSLSNRVYVQEMAFKALFDLILCHGPTAVDLAREVVQDSPDSLRQPGLQVAHLFFSNGDRHVGEHNIILRIPVVELLAGSFQPEDPVGKAQAVRPTTAAAVEGFAKLLLQGKHVLEIRRVQDTVLQRLICLYFSPSTENHPRLRQCLNVFFRAYCSQSDKNKRAISKIFVAVMRKEWPGICGNREKAGTVLAARKHAAEIGRYMLMLLQLPLMSNVETTLIPGQDEAVNEGHEELAIRIFSEVISLRQKTSMAGKTYIATLCRFCTLLEYRACQEEEIKCLCQLLPNVMENLPPGEKVLMKEFKDLQVHLRTLNRSPDKSLTDKEMRQIMGELSSIFSHPLILDDGTVFYQMYSEFTSLFVSFLSVLVSPVLDRIGVENYGEEPENVEVEDTPLKAPKTTGRKKASSVSQNTTVMQTPAPPSTRTLRKRPESLLSLAKTQAADGLSKTTVLRRNLDSLYESDNTGNDAVTTSSSGDEYEVGAPSKGKTGQKTNAPSGTSNRPTPASTTTSDIPPLDIPSCPPSRREDSSGEGNSGVVDEVDEGEDVATPLPVGRGRKSVSVQMQRMSNGDAGGLPSIRETNSSVSLTKANRRGKKAGTSQKSTRRTSVSGVVRKPSSVVNSSPKSDDDDDDDFAPLPPRRRMSSAR
ncbi:hypothetical protein R1sor_026986 [Riccia sorocarpa]|uniref:Nuclear condensin complex subunit 3 C-terminal domain-containing protein n=1 Tax=Riccia sorocarpa TaxID=122646 RepID=A0ABD3GCX4_9MARC